MSNFIAKKNLEAELEKYKYKNVIFVDYTKQIILLPTSKTTNPLTKEITVRLLRSTIQTPTPLTQRNKHCYGSSSTVYTTKELATNLNSRNWGMFVLTPDGYSAVFSAYVKKPQAFTPEEHRAIEHIESNYLLYRHYI